MASSWALSEVWSLLRQPSAPEVAAIVAAFVGILIVAVTTTVLNSGEGLGSNTSAAQLLFATYVRFGRLRNLLCGACDRVRRRYPLAITCQIPFFANLSDVYTFVFGYKTDGLFVEVGAYDGESFSNTSGLADLGWRGYYLEPIPAYAEVCRRRHAGNKGVTVDTVCIGERDGEEVSLSAAGPFTSAVDDEIDSVSASSGLGGMLKALGWSHNAAAAKVTTKTKSLNTYLTAKAVPKAGAIDVMVVDTEGFEWPILRGFDLRGWAPKLVIVEVQEKQARYAKNQRVQEDAAALDAYFRSCGYGILYKDVVNTIYIHKDVQCQGGA